MGSSPARPTCYPPVPLPLRPTEAMITCLLGDTQKEGGPGLEAPSVSPSSKKLRPPALAHRPVMMEAENFTIFIKNSIRFPLFNFEK